MSDEIILFDLPSKGRSACWSLNPWKGTATTTRYQDTLLTEITARLGLNYKGLPYKTEWTEYPDIAPKYKSFGLAANTPAINPTAEYSIPAARMPDGTYIMDSLAIARALETLQPEPSLRLDTGYVERTQSIIKDLHTALVPITLPRVPAIC